MFITLLLAAAFAGEPDWDHAVFVTSARSVDGAVVRLDVAPGFHVYGAKEKRALPLEVHLTGHEEVVAVVPDGVKKKLPGLGKSRVLEGRIEVGVPTALPPPFVGWLKYQVCTDSACAPPVEHPWKVE